MHAKVAQHGFIDIELRHKRDAKPRPPAPRSPPSYIKMLVFSAVKPFLRTSAPIALTPSRVVMAG